jgi:methylphosphotriester-DNA--protein-cysteine methyltransferase
MEASKACSEQGFILNRKTGIIHRPDCPTLPRLPWLPYGTTWVQTESVGLMRPCCRCLPDLAAAAARPS